MTNYREILRHANIGLNRTSIGTTLGYSRNTVADVLKRAGEKNITWPLPGGMSDVELEALLYPEKAAKEANRRMPDYEKIHKDLGRRGVTFSLLWDEYCADCRQTGEIPYGYTQFRYHYYKYVQQNKATMHIEHKPGYEVEVDWAGATLSVMDSDTGEVQPAYLFVGALPCSGYAYVEAFLSTDNEAWINAHVHMFSYFGGVPRIITPDNLKTGVVKANYYEPRDAIISLWETADADLEACQARADWIMESLYLDDLAYSSVIGLNQTDDVYMTALSIANLLFTALPYRVRKNKRKRYVARCKYFEWLENRMLRSRFAVEPRLMGAVAEVLKRMLDPLDESLDMDGDTKLAGDAKLAKAYIAQQFYEDIPVYLREELSRDQEFIANIGIGLFSVVQIGKVTLKKSEFIQAVSESINGRRGTAKPLETNEPEVIFEPYTESSASCVIMYPRKNQQVLIDDEIFLILRENPSERELMLRKNRQWFDCSIEQFNKVVPEIATIHDPQRRFEETERWHSSSISVYYQRLSEILNKNHVIARNDLDLPSAEKLCWFLRISPASGYGEEFQKGLYQAAEELLKENELFVALERLCALPVPLPLTLLDRVRRLEPSVRRQLVKTLIRSTGSPLSKIHFLRILTACNEKQYFRLARRIIVHLLGEAGKKEFEAFKAILEWVEAESSTWSANGLPYHIRLGMVWVHTHFLYSVIVGAGAPAPWVSKIFRNFSSALSIELFRREPSYWYDISHPSQVNCTSFLLSGIAYAFEDKANILISSQIREHLDTIACYVDENIQLPSPSMFRDSSMSMDTLSSFLSGDRGQTLKLLLSEEKAAMLSSKSIQSTLSLVVDTLGIASNNIGAWTIILNILQGGPPDEDVLPRLVEVFKGTNYSELYKSDAECGLIALRATAVQMASIRNEDLKTHLIQQILEISKWCSSQPSEQAYKIGDDMSARKVAV